MNEQKTNNGTTSLPNLAGPARDAPDCGPPAPLAAQAAPPPWLQPLQLTIEQTAILTNYSVRTLKRLVRAGEIPGITRVGRSLRLNRHAIERWIEEGCPRPGRRTGRR